MAADRAGGFEFDGRGYRFNDAHCGWSPGHLDLEAEGKRCGLRLVAIPFPGATEVSELVGRVWEPDDDERAIHADTFAEGGLEVGDLELWIMGGRIECRRYDADRGILTIDFRLTVLDGEDGREDEADGVAYCRVVGDEDDDV